MGLGRMAVIDERYNTDGMNRWFRFIPSGGAEIVRLKLDQVLAGFESDGVPALDFDLFTGLGVTPHAGLAIDLLEGSEAHQGYTAVAFF